MADILDLISRFPTWLKIMWVVWAIWLIITIVMTHKLVRALISLRRQKQSAAGVSRESDAREQTITEHRRRTL